MQRNLDQFGVCTVIVICLVIAHILHDKIRYCQVLFNSYYVTCISVLCYRNVHFLVFFFSPIFVSTTEMQQKLERTKKN